MPKLTWYWTRDDGGLIKAEPDPAGDRWHIWYTPPVPGHPKRLSVQSFWLGSAGDQAGVVCIVKEIALRLPPNPEETQIVRRLNTPSR